MPYCSVQNVLLKAVKQEYFINDLNTVTALYTGDLEFDKLQVQLQLLSTMASKEAVSNKELISFLQSLSSPRKSLLSEVVTLAKQIIEINIE